MKKINLSKKMKVVLGVSAVAAFVPIVAVSAVACSNGSNNDQNPSGTSNTTPVNAVNFVNEFNSNQFNNVTTKNAQYSTTFQGIMQKALANNLANLNNDFNFNAVSGATNSFSQAIAPTIQSSLQNVLKNNLSSFKNANLTQNDIDNLQVIAAVPFISNESNAVTTSVTKSGSSLTLNVTLTPDLVTFVTFKNLTSTYTINGQSVTIPQIIPLNITGFQPVDVYSTPIAIKDLANISSIAEGLISKANSLINSFSNVANAVANADNSASKTLASLVQAMNTNKLNVIDLSNSAAANVKSDLELSSLQSAVSLTQSSSNSSSYTQKLSTDLTTYLQSVVKDNEDTTLKSLNLSASQISNLKVYYSAVTSFNVSEINGNIGNLIPGGLIPSGLATVPTTTSTSITPSVYSFITDGGSTVSLTLNGVTFNIPPTQIISWSGLSAYQASDSNQVTQTLQSIISKSLSPFLANGSAFTSQIQTTIATVSNSMKTMVQNIIKQITGSITGGLFH